MDAARSGTLRDAWRAMGTNTMTRPNWNTPTITQSDIDTIPLDERLRESGYTPLDGDEPGMEPSGWLIVAAMAVGVVSLLVLALIWSPAVARMIGGFDA